jgi:hypothetical protein
MQQDEQLETVEGDCPKHFPGLRIGNTPEEQLELNQPAMDLLQSWIETDKISVAEPESAIASQQEYALPEATRAQDLPVPDGWEAIEANDTAVAEPEQADAGWEAIAPSETETIAPAIEPELDDSECDRIAIDEPEQAIAGDAELSGADEVLLDDEDPTEQRHWAGDEAEIVESPVMSHQGEDDADALAGDEA